jgi:hypothetical protein
MLLASILSVDSGSVKRAFGGVSPPNIVFGSKRYSSIHNARTRQGQSQTEEKHKRYLHLQKYGGGTEISGAQGF